MGHIIGKQLDGGKLCRLSQETAEELVAKYRSYGWTAAIINPTGFRLEVIYENPESEGRKHKKRRAGKT